MSLALSAGEQADFTGALRRMGLTGPGERPQFTPLTGGVSSVILQVALGERILCIKRARERLAVAAEWRAPIERSQTEVAWLRLIGNAMPDAVPAVLAEDRATGCFAMRYLPPASYPNWKARLSAGDVDADFAASVGRILGHIHRLTARSEELAQRFDRRGDFHALRLAPYFLEASRVNPDQAPALRELVQRTAAADIAVMHGDVSPKNILCGPRGPVLLDAECACAGDPGFDVAFCITHLLLKSVWHPGDATALLASAERLLAAYRPHIDWEDAQALEARCCDLVGALLLARVDGKSPVEYLSPSQRDRVRSSARDMLADRPQRFADLCARWQP